MDDTKCENQLGLSKEILSKVKIPRKFEIFVEEFDEEGGPGHTPIWRAVKVDPTLGGMGGNPTITVNSQSDLQEKQNFYRQIGQRFKIVREIDPPSAEDIRKAAVEQGLLAAEQTGIEAQAPDPASANTESQARKSAVPQPADAQFAKKPQSKIITIGDMQIKYDGDQVYQKQWVRLTSQEASNFRVVSDANNKIVQMNGKHIEAKRWILVENAQHDEDNTEELINA